jgi:hypothetical protein
MSHSLTQKRRGRPYEKAPRFAGLAIRLERLHHRVGPLGARQCCPRTPWVASARWLRKLLGRDTPSAPSLLSKLHQRSISQHTLFVYVYRSGTKYRTIVQYLLLVFTILEGLEGPVHGGNELVTTNCNYRHNEPCKNIILHRDIFWCNN